MVAVARPAKSSAGACRVCALAPHQVAWADAKILEGRSARYVAQNMTGGVTRKDVAEHALRCPNSKKTKEEAEEHANKPEEQGTDA